jgi:hypothetical protein
MHRSAFSPTYPIARFHAGVYSSGKEPYCTRYKILSRAGNGAIARTREGLFYLVRDRQRPFAALKIKVSHGSVGSNH